MITVFGLGFVGLTTALGFAHYGNLVYGIDADLERAAILKDGKLPFLEPHMDIALAKHNNSNFIITNDVNTAIKNSEFIFYCVGTPYGENGEADLKYLFSALEETIRHLDKGKPKTLIIKSTIPPSTTKERVIPFVEEHGLRVGNDVFVANNPEFLREGHCWDDFINADRVVIGCDDQKAVELISCLYKPFNRPVYSVSYNSGEFIKYLSNTMLATMISFANEMSIIADAIGDIEVAKAFKILHGDKRWGNATMSSYVYPGCGYGGYCLPKDTNALYAISKSKGYEPAILGNVIELNNNMINNITDKITKNCTPTQRIGILGLSFKPNSNDVRESVSAKIIKKLIEREYNNIYAYDPVAIQEFRENYNYPINYCNDLEETCEKADVLVILTGWQEFLQIKDITGKNVLDFRYIL